MRIFRGYFTRGYMAQAGVLQAGGRLTGLRFFDKDCDDSDVENNPDNDGKKKERKNYCPDNDGKKREEEKSDNIIDCQR